MSNDQPQRSVQPPIKVSNRGVQERCPASDQLCDHPPAYTTILACNHAHRKTQVAGKQSQKVKDTSLQRIVVRGGGRRKSHSNPPRNTEEQERETGRLFSRPHLRFQPTSTQILFESPSIITFNPPQSKASSHPRAYESQLASNHGLFTSPSILTFSSPQPKASQNPQAP